MHEVVFGPTPLLEHVFWLFAPSSGNKNWNCWRWSWGKGGIKPGFHYFFFFFPLVVGKAAGTGKASLEQMVLAGILLRTEFKFLSPSQTPRWAGAAAEPGSGLNLPGISRPGLKIAAVFSVRLCWNRSLGMVSVYVPLLNSHFSFSSDSLPGFSWWTMFCSVAWRKPRADGCPELIISHGLSRGREILFPFFVFLQNIYVVNCSCGYRSSMFLILKCWPWNIADFFFCMAKL